MNTKPIIGTIFLTLAVTLRGSAALDALPEIKTPVVADKIAGQVYPFDLAQVHLLAGPFQQAQEMDRQNLLKVDLNLLYYPFRHVAHLPSPVKGSDALGWPVTGHALGHFLSASAMLWRNTGDLAIKQRADAAVAVLAECQAANGNGYIGGFPEKSILELEGLVKDKAFHANVPWYCLHKVYAGLLDMYVLTGNPQALSVLETAAGWIEKNLSQLDDQQMEAMLKIEHGGMKELLVNLYAATGKTNYLSLAERFTHHAVLGPFLQGQDPLDGLHANTQFPKFIGLTRQYEVTGDAALGKVVTTFWDNVVNERSYVTGGNSVREHFSPKGHLSENVTQNTTETCNEYNMLRLTRDLFCLDPQPKYADFYERALFNQILSARKPDDGGQLYFQQLESGRSKEKWGYLGNNVTCCCGSGLESAAKFADSIYFHDDANGLFVNLLIPSVLDWPGKGLSLRQETQYPEAGRASFVFTCAQPVALTVNVRRPWWATADFQILVNGKKQKLASTAGSFVPVQRTWKNGDKLEVVMPMTFRLEGFQDNPDRVAVMYGPLVMAAVTETGNRYSVIQADQKKCLASFKPVAGQLLTFTAPAQVFRTSATNEASQPIRFKPLFRIVNEPYAVYWNLRAP